MGNRQIDYTGDEVFNDIYRKLAGKIDLQSRKERELDREKRGDQEGISVWSTSHMESVIHALKHRSCRLDRSFTVDK